MNSQCNTGVFGIVGRLSQYMVLYISGVSLFHLKRKHNINFKNVAVQFVTRCKLLFKINNGLCMFHMSSNVRSQMQLILPLERTSVLRQNQHRSSFSCIVDQLLALCIVVSLNLYCSILIAYASKLYDAETKLKNCFTVVTCIKITVFNNIAVLFVCGILKCAY